MTMRVTIKSTVMGESGSLLTAGSTYSVSDKLGAELVGSKRATDTDGVLTPLQSENKPFIATDPLTGQVTGMTVPGGVSFSAPISLGGVVNTVLIGDSMTASASGGASITSLTRTSGIATLTISGGHTTGDGDFGNVYNATDATFNQNGVRVTRVSPTVLTYASPGPDATASSVGGTMLMQWQRLSYCNENSFFFWLQAKSKGAFRMAFNGGRNGQDSYYMAARFKAEALTENPNAQCVVLFTGANDFLTQTVHYTADQVYANVISMVNQCAGKFVIVVSAIPWVTASTDTYRKEAMRYNRLIRAYCNGKQNVRFADAAKYIVDASATTKFTPLTGMLLGDGVHPSPRGAERIAQAIWDVVQTNVSTPSRLISSNGDCITFDASSRNFGAEWTFNNTDVGARAGSPNPAIGPVVGNLAVTNNGGTSATCTIPARSDGIGYDQQVVWVAAAANDTLIISYPGTMSAGWAVGDRFQLLAELALIGMSGQVLKSMDIKCGFTGGNTSGWTCAAQGTGITTYATTDQTLTLVSPELTIPLGTTGVGLTITFTAAQAGTLTTKLGRLSLERL